MNIILLCKISRVVKNKMSQTHDIPNKITIMKIIYILFQCLLGFYEFKQVEFIIYLFP